MKPGSVLVDLGADGGGNCELSKPGETVQVGGVTILAPLNLPATMPFHASLLFSRNLTAFVLAFTKDRAFQLDLTDDIQQGALITHDGEVKNTRTREALEKARPPIARCTTTDSTTEDTEDTEERLAKQERNQWISGQPSTSSCSRRSSGSV